MAYRPPDRAEFEEGLRAEVLDMPEPSRRLFKRVAIQVFELTSLDFPGRPIFIVAKSGQKAIFYDDVEEGFGIGTIDGHSLKDCSLIGELRLALVQLQGA